MRRSSTAGPALCGERNGSRSGKREAKPSEHRQVSVERDPLAATEAKRRQAVLVVQAPELALDGCAASVEVAPALRLARNERVPTVSFHPPGGGVTLSGWAAPTWRAAA